MERFSKWGGQIFGSQKWRVITGRRACAMQGSVRSWELFWKYGLKWSNLVHYFSSCYTFNTMFTEVFKLTLEQDGQKSGGAMPPNLKRGGSALFRRLWGLWFVIILNLKCFTKVWIYYHSANVCWDFWIKTPSCKSSCMLGLYDFLLQKKPKNKKIGPSLVHFTNYFEHLCKVTETNKT